MLPRNVHDGLFIGSPAPLNVSFAYTLHKSLTAPSNAVAFSPRTVLLLNVLIALMNASFAGAQAEEGLRYLCSKVTAEHPCIQPLC